MLNKLFPVLLCCMLVWSGAVSAQPDYAAYNSLLQRYVSETGKVDYAGLRRQMDSLRALTHAFSQYKPDNWPRDTRLAFWINTYNAFTLRRIVEHYPLNSITELDGGKTWDLQNIPVGGKMYSLNQIENDIIRPQFKDPRIHFALNCAARSCPPLLNRAYLPATLQRQLDEQTRKFINGPAMKLSAESLELSKLFDWYKDDFGDVIVFLNRYSKIVIKSGAKISYREYDWALNGV